MGNIEESKEYHLLGVYFNDQQYTPPPRAKKLISNPNHKENIYTDTYFSDMYYLVEYNSCGLKDKVLRLSSGRDMDYYATYVINTKISEYNIPGTLYTPVKLTGCIVPDTIIKEPLIFINLSKKNKNVFFKKMYVDSILKLHPNSKTFIRTADIQNRAYWTSNLVFKSDSGEIVGLISPMILENTNAKIIISQQG
jgi:hypothetical protein